MSTEPEVVSLEVHNAQLAELNTKLTDLAAQLLTATNEKTAALASVGELTGKLAEVTAVRDSEIAKVSDLTAKLADAERYDARKLGVAPMRIAAAQLAKKTENLATPEQKLAAYEAMTDPAEREAFRRANRDALFAALSARK
jgi:hypothetical protein